MLRRRRKKDAATRLRETLARIAAEKGADLPLLNTDDLRNSDDDDDEEKSEKIEIAEDEQDDEEKPDVPLTYEELTKMRQDVLMKLE